MIKLFSKFLLILILIGSIQTYAQFQNGRGVGGGLDRDDLSTQNRYNEAKNRPPVDYVKVMSDNLTDKLKLDGFQSAIVKNLIEDFIKKSNEIMQENIPQEAKVEKTGIARKTMEARFQEIFTDQQKALFEEFTSEKSSKIKKKKKRKDSEE